MQMEDKESTESGSLSGDSDTDSPPPPPPLPPVMADVGSPGALSMAQSMGMERSAEATNAPPLPAVVGGDAVSGGAIGAAAGGVSGGGGSMSGGVGSGGGSGDLMAGKKKRGRPRKYDSEGNLRPQYLASKSRVQSPPLGGFTLTSPHSSGFPSGSKKGRGRSSASGNWQVLATFGELLASTAGGDFTPHVVTVYTGEDVAGKIFQFVQRGTRGICVLSANGSVSNVTIRQPGSSGGLLTYEGRFEILTLTGSYTFSENGGIKGRSGGLSVSLAGPDGRVIGGGVAGSLLAASPIQIVVGSFMPNGYHKMPKKRHYPEPRASAVMHGTPVNVTVAKPISQAAPPQSNISPMPSSQMPVQSQGAADNSNSISNKENPNSASTDTADWNGLEPISEQRPSPDINMSAPLE